MLPCTPASKLDTSLRENKEKVEYVLHLDWGKKKPRPPHTSVLLDELQRDA